MLKALFAATAAAALLSVAACEGGAEKAGENMDSAVENATTGEEKLSDGPLEKAGESVDRATGAERQGDTADAINDATDGDSRTRP